MAPEVQIVLLHCANGFVADMAFITRQQRHGDDPGWTRDATPEAVEAEIQKASQSYPREWLPIASWRYADVTELSLNRRYRAAWSDVDGKLGIDMPRARELKRDQLRERRRVLLEALDVEYLQADERDDQDAKGRVTAQKRLLREAPNDPRIDAAQTVEELDAINLGDR